MVVIAILFATIRILTPLLMFIWCGIGKNWHAPKKAFRPTAGQTSYAKRLEERKAMAVMKEKEKEMKEEKEATRQVGCFYGLKYQYSDT